MDAKHVAKLANLPLKSGEVRKFKKQLLKVVGYIDELSEVNVKGVEPTAQTTGLEDIYREDVAEKSISAEEALSGTEKTHNGYFVVGRVLTRDE